MMFGPWRPRFCPRLRDPLLFIPGGPYTACFRPEQEWMFSRQVGSLVSVISELCSCGVVQSVSSVCLACSCTISICRSNSVLSEFGEEDRRQEVGCGRMLPSLSLPCLAPCDLQAAGVRPSSSCLWKRQLRVCVPTLARVCESSRSLLRCGRSLKARRMLFWGYAFNSVCR
jgi:hypothetical protein